MDDDVRRARRARRPDAPPGVVGGGRAPTVNGSERQWTAVAAAVHGVSKKMHSARSALIGWTTILK
ncbi:hypothetical protein [Jiangella endophytica]|uniref:hypothetical protein n=1 Tax=Jiangella endophytica TaxID=1623398 RepID=UPI0013003569|nr:hypothetical protein [Jiangella endophytica]